MPTRQDPTLSIIMPVYNVINYLDEAIDSVLENELDDFELILVNDGSTDGSAELAQERHKQDSRIRVVNQENGGLASARNTGVRESLGQYIAFLDSDDLTTPNGYKMMVETLDKTGSDYITGQMLMWRRTNKKRSDLHRRSHRTNLVKQTIQTHPDIVFDTTVTNKVIRRSFWVGSEISFPEGRLYEDFIPSTILFTKAKSFDVTSTPMYVWRIRSEGGSITQRRQEFQNLYDRMEMMLEVREMVRAVPGSDRILPILNFKNLWVDLNLYRPWKFGGVVDEEYRNFWIQALKKVFEETSPSDFEDLAAKIKLSYWLAANDRYNDIEALHSWFDDSPNLQTPYIVSKTGAQIEAKALPFDTTDIPEWTFDIDPEIRTEAKIESIDWVSKHQVRIRGYAFVSHVSDGADQEVQVYAKSKTTGRAIQLHTTRTLSETANRESKINYLDFSQSGFEATLDVTLLDDLQDKSIWTFEAQISSPYRPQSKGLSFTRSRQGRVPSVANRVTGKLIYFVPNKNSRTQLIAQGSFIEANSLTINNSDLIAEVHSTESTSATRSWMGTFKSRTLGRLKDRQQSTQAWLVNAKTKAKYPANVATNIDSGNLIINISLPTSPKEQGANWYFLLKQPYSAARRVSITSETSVDDNILSAYQNGGFTFTIIDAPALIESSKFDQGCLRIDLTRAASDGLEVGIGRDSESIREWVTVSSITPTADIPLFKTGEDGISRPIRSGEYTLFSRSIEHEISPLRSTIEGFDDASHILDLPKSRFTFRTDRRTHNAELSIRRPVSALEESPYGRNARKKYWLSHLDPEPLDAVLFYDYFGRAQIDSSYNIHRELVRRKIPIDSYFAIEDYSVPYPEEAKPVLVGSDDWIELQQRCKYIFANVTLGRNLPKPEFQTFVQLWHGTPMKHIGATVWKKRGASNLIRQEEESASWDYLISQSPFATRTLREAFLYQGPTLDIGYPRNDPLASISDFVRGEILQRLGIDPARKVLLYAPTFRDSHQTRGFAARMADTLDLDSFVSELDPDWVVLLRGHGLVAAHGQVFETDNRVVDVTDVPNINDLYQVADLLVTDYSSAVFDFSVTKKPFLLYTPDLESYKETRGLYVDPVELSPIPLNFTEEELLQSIADLPQLVRDNANKFEEFRNTYIPWDNGEASSKIVELIFGESN